MPFEIKHTVTGAIFHIAEDDFLVEMTLEEAQKACNQLGNGWRLPEIEELKSMHKFLYQGGRVIFRTLGIGKVLACTSILQMGEPFA